MKSRLLTLLLSIAGALVPVSLVQAAGSPSPDIGASGSSSLATHTVLSDREGPGDRDGDGPGDGDGDGGRDGDGRGDND